jgi:hypothetical protein
MAAAQVLVELALLYVGRVLTAENSATGEIYLASDYASRSTSYKDARKDFLICTGCGQKAHIIHSKPTRSFGSMTHLVDCRWRARQSIHVQVASLREGDERAAPAHEYVLEMGEPTEYVHIQHDPNAAPHSGPGSQHRGSKGSVVTTPRMQLAALLQLLLNDRSYRHSEDILRVLGKPRSISDLTVDALDIKNSHIGETRLYWGRITFADPMDSGAWLRLGPSPVASIWLDRNMFAQLLASLGTSDPRLLKWAGFIYWGAPGLSGSRIVLRPDSLKTFAVRLHHGS